MSQLVKIAAAVAAVTLIPFTLAAQEFSYENMTGRSPLTSPSRLPVMAYGEDPGLQFPPKSASRPRTVQTDTEASGYCVRTCDGRYFPAPSGDKATQAEGCKNLCPATETSVYYGSSIDGAFSQKGKPYSALANAFRYRKELVAGCSCNGKDTTGLAPVKIENDKTLQRGDMVASTDGLNVVRKVVDGAPQFAGLRSDRSATPNAR